MRAYQMLPYDDPADTPLASEDRHPVDYIEPIERSNIQASDVITQFYVIFQGEDKLGYKLDCLALASGLHGTMGITVSDIARKYGVSKAAVSMQATKYCDYFGLPQSEYQRRRNPKSASREMSIDRLKRLIIYKAAFRLGVYLHKPEHRKQSTRFYRIWLLILRPIVRAYIVFQRHETEAKKREAAARESS